MTQTRIEYELIQHLDFEPENPCDLCDGEAMWKTTVVCCDAAWLLCAYHEVYNEGFLDNAPYVTCRACDREFEPPRTIIKGKRRL